MTSNTRFGFDPASVFDPVAAQYRAARPGYPQSLYDSLDRLVGGLDGAGVVDVGAGTGIASAGLAGRGARVTAVEPSLAMLGRPGSPAVCARAEAIPLRSGSADLVTCAQAWHWVDAALAVPECRRVLRDGGHLALWWNVSEGNSAWLGEIEAVSGLPPYGAGGHQDDAETLTATGVFTAVEYRDFAWRWTVPVETWLAVAATRSSIASVRQDPGALLRAIRAVLGKAFPDGAVTELMTCHLVLAVAAA